MTFDAAIEDAVSFAHPVWSFVDVAVWRALRPKSHVEIWAGTYSMHRTHYSTHFATIVAVSP